MILSDLNIVLFSTTYDCNCFVKSKLHVFDWVKERVNVLIVLTCMIRGLLLSMSGRCCFLGGFIFSAILPVIVWIKQNQKNLICAKVYQRDCFSDYFVQDFCTTQLSTDTPRTHFSEGNINRIPKREEECTAKSGHLPISRQNFSNYLASQK